MIFRSRKFSEEEAAAAAQLMFDDAETLHDHQNHTIHGSRSRRFRNRIKKIVDGFIAGIDFAAEDDLMSAPEPTCGDRRNGDAPYFPWREAE